MKRLSCLVIICAVSVPAAAVDWDIRPRVYAAETYTDNLRLTEDDKDGEFVSEITPGIEINAGTQRFEFDADVAVQNIFYVDESDENATNIFGHVDLKSELVRNWLFLDAGVSSSQVNATVEGPRSRDNLNPNGNRADVVSYSVSPYVRHSFQNYVTLYSRLTAQKVDYSNPGSSNVSDAELYSGLLSLNSGAYFNQTRWGLSYYKSKDDVREIEEGTRKRESLNAYVDRVINRTVTFLVRAGETRNDISGIEEGTDGNYWSAGFRWTPSSKFYMEALSGSNDKQAAIHYEPSDRVSFDLGWQDREVGVVIGDSWHAEAIRDLGNSRLYFRYSDEVTNTQRLSTSTLAPEDYLSPALIAALPPSLIDLLFDDLNVFTLVNQEFRRKRAELGYEFETSRYKWDARIFAEDRESFTTTLDADRAYGLDFTHIYRFQDENRLTTGFYWDRIKDQLTSREADYYNLYAGYTFVLSRDAEVTTGFRVNNRDGDLGREYNENRVFISFLKYF